MRMVGVIVSSVIVSRVVVTNVFSVVMSFVGVAKRSLAECQKSSRRWRRNKRRCGKWHKKKPSS